MNDLNEKKNTQADPGSLDSLREEFGADNKHFQRWQVISLLLMVYDAVAVNIAYLAALWLRHDCQFSAIEARFLNPWKGFAPFYTVAALLVFWFLRLYKSVWRFASYTELVRICMASAITFVIHTVGITMMYRRMPMTYYFFGAILQFILNSNHIFLPTAIWKRCCFYYSICYYTVIIFNNFIRNICKTLI